MRLVIDNSLVSSVELANLLSEPQERVEASIDTLASIGFIQPITSHGVKFVNAHHALLVATKASPNACRIINEHWHRIEFCLSGESEQKEGLAVG